MLTTKKLFFSVIAILVIVSAIIVSCDRSSTPEPVNHWIENIDEVVSAYNTTIHLEEFKGFNKKGEVNVFSFEDDDGEEIFAIYFSTPDFEKNQVFRLQSQESIHLPNEVSSHFSNAQVIYLGDHLIVNDLNSSFNAKFSISGNNLEIVKQLQFKLDRDIFGLNISTYDKGISFRNVKAASCKCHPLSVFPLPTCSSGGVGSSQCSTTCGPDDACSVTCDSGYFACCNCD